MHAKCSTETARFVHEDYMHAQVRLIPRACVYVQFEQLACVCFFCALYTNLLGYANEYGVSDN